MSKRLKGWIATLQRHADAWWYAPVISFLAALDAFVLVIPTDGLLVGASMLCPRRWIYTAIVVTIGSSLGSWALAAILNTHGLPFLLYLSPGIEQSEMWIWTDQMMDRWGPIVLFLVALSPFMQQPAVALAALASMPLTQIFLLVFAGRILKYGFLSWIATHAPGYLGNLWGMKGELEEVGVDPEHPELPPDPEKAPE